MLSSFTFTLLSVNSFEGISCQKYWGWGTSVASWGWNLVEVWYEFSLQLCLEHLLLNWKNCPDFWQGFVFWLFFYYKNSENKCIVLCLDICILWVTDFLIWNYDMKLWFEITILWNHEFMNYEVLQGFFCFKPSGKKTLFLSMLLDFNMAPLLSSPV